MCGVQGKMDKPCKEIRDQLKSKPDLERSKM